MQDRIEPYVRKVKNGFKAGFKVFYDNELVYTSDMKYSTTFVNREDAEEEAKWLVKDAVQCDFRIRSGEVVC